MTDSRRSRSGLLSERLQHVSDSRIKPGEMGTKDVDEYRRIVAIKRGTQEIFGVALSVSTVQLDPRLRNSNE